MAAPRRGVAGDGLREPAAHERGRAERPLPAGADALRRRRHDSRGDPAAERVLTRMHFAIEKLDAEQGVVKTRPLRGAQFFEFWRSDNVSSYDCEEANLQSVRRTVELRVKKEAVDRRPEAGDALACRLRLRTCASSAWSRCSGWISRRMRSPASRRPTRSARGPRPRCNGSRSAHSSGGPWPGSTWARIRTWPPSPRPHRKETRGLTICRLRFTIRTCGSRSVREPIVHRKWEIENPCGFSSVAEPGTSAAT